jgi:hypothetical protein
MVQRSKKRPQVVVGAGGRMPRSPLEVGKDLGKNLKKGPREKIPKTNHPFFTPSALSQESTNRSPAPPRVATIAFWGTRSRGILQS